MRRLWILAAALALGCSDAAEPAQAGKTTHDYSLEVMFATKQQMQDWVGEVAANVEAMCAAAPAPDADGWNLEDDRAAVEAMRQHWIATRTHLVRLDFPFRVAFPDVEESLVGVYDVALIKEGDEYPFDSRGFIGLHAIERILWADHHPAPVVAFEKTLDYYEPPAFPRTEQEARDFSEHLCGELLEQFRGKGEIFRGMIIEPLITIKTIDTAVWKQFDKIQGLRHDSFQPRYALAARYAPALLGEMREAVAGSRLHYQPFREWLRARPGGEGLDAEIEAGFDRVLAVMDAVGQDALPPIPATWDERAAGPGDLQTAFGVLYTVLRDEMNPTLEGSLTNRLKTAIAVLEAEIAGRHMDPVGPLEGLIIARDHPGFAPIPGIDAFWQERWDRGRLVSEADYLEDLGLGPVYITNNCFNCHFDVAAGERGLVGHMSLRDTQGNSQPEELFPFGTVVRPNSGAGATKGVFAPNDDTIQVQLRAAPALYGRGYMEAVLESEILRMEHEQSLRTDGISGRVNWIVYESETNPDDLFHSFEKGQTVMGRFGLKSQHASLDDANAAAFVTDMSITSPLRPHELPNPEGLTDDLKPGLDLTLEQITLASDFTRGIRLPERGNFPIGYRPLQNQRRKEPDHGNPPQLDPAGEAAFLKAKCGVCHVPTLRTRPDYPIPILRDYDAPIYTDLLLHDMGAALADGIQSGTATAREWRTAPLIGMATLDSFMHDARATSIEEAIFWHGEEDSEARASWDAYQALSDAEKALLIKYVEGL